MLDKDKKSGYLAVLKKPLQGKSADLFIDINNGRVKIFLVYDFKIYFGD